MSAANSISKDQIMTDKSIPSPASVDSVMALAEKSKRAYGAFVSEYTENRANVKNSNLFALYQSAEDALRAEVEALATQRQGEGETDYEAHQKNGLAWAISRWQAEVQNRPLINVHRRSLDDAWRQTVRYFGGDPDKVLGPSHDALMDAEPKRNGRPVSWGSETVLGHEYIPSKD